MSLPITTHLSQSVFAEYFKTQDEVTFCADTTLIISELDPQLCMDIASSPTRLGEKLILTLNSVLKTAGKMLDSLQTEGTIVFNLSVDQKLLKLNSNREWKILTRYEDLTYSLALICFIMEKSGIASRIIQVKPNQRLFLQGLRPGVTSISSLTGTYRDNKQNNSILRSCLWFPPGFSLNIKCEPLQMQLGKTAESEPPSFVTLSSPSGLELKITKV